MNLNMIYRWEYRPGSALYLVWAHSRYRADIQSDVDPERTGAFSNGVGTDPLFDNEAENRLLAKISYWLSI